MVIKAGPFTRKMHPSRPSNSQLGGPCYIPMPLEMRIAALCTISIALAGCASLSYDGYDFEQCKPFKEGHYLCEVSLQTFKKYLRDEEGTAIAVTKKHFEGKELCTNGYDIKWQRNVRTGDLGYYWNVICR